jgi:hypothetical protein
MRFKLSDDATHKTLKIKARLARRSLSCSFYTDFRVMDQSDRALVRRTHQKSDPARCPTFIDLHNRNPKPLMAKSADQILDSVKRFCHKAQQTLCGELQIHVTRA